MREAEAEARRARRVLAAVAFAFAAILPLFLGEGGAEHARHPSANPLVPGSHLGRCVCGAAFSGITDASFR